MRTVERTKDRSVKVVRNINTVKRDREKRIIERNINAMKRERERKKERKKEGAIKDKKEEGRW